MAFVNCKFRPLAEEAITDVLPFKYRHLIIALYSTDSMITPQCRFTLETFIFACLKIVCNVWMYVLHMQIHPLRLSEVNQDKHFMYLLLTLAKFLIFCNASICFVTLPLYVIFFISLLL